MADYRLLIRDAATGRVVDETRLTRADDRSAIRSITPLARGRDTELWHRTRLVAIRHGRSQPSLRRRSLRRLRAWLRLTLGGRRDEGLFVRS